MNATPQYLMLFVTIHLLHGGNHDLGLDRSHKTSTQTYSSFYVSSVLRAGWRLYILDSFTPGNLSLSDANRSHRPVSYLWNTHISLRLLCLTISYRRGLASIRFLHLVRRLPPHGHLRPRPATTQYISGYTWRCPNARARLTLSNYTML